MFSRSTHSTRSNALPVFAFLANNNEPASTAAHAARVRSASPRAAAELQRALRCAATPAIRAARAYAVCCGGRTASGGDRDAALAAPPRAGAARATPPVKRTRWAARLGRRAGRGCCRRSRCSGAVCAAARVRRGGSWLRGALLLRGVGRGKGGLRRHRRCAGADKEGRRKGA